MFILYHNFSEEFIINTDASKTQLGGVINKFVCPFDFTHVNEPCTNKLY